jgi:tRNA threonylcarbamoyl adenosine modification protein YeaZ
MFTLAIDTSGRVGSVAIVRDRQVLLELSSCDDSPYSSRLFRDLGLLQAKGQFTLADVDLFAVVTGPGSFTGVRVGLTATKAWAEVYGKPVAGVSGLEAIAAQAPAGRSLVAAFSDARRGQVFGAIFRREFADATRLERVGDEVLAAPSEFLGEVGNAVGQNRLVLVSPNPDCLGANFHPSDRPGWLLERVSPVLAPVAGKLAFGRASRGALRDALHLEANYIRRCDAERPT